MALSFSSNGLVFQFFAPKPFALSQHHKDGIPWMFPAKVRADGLVVFEPHLCTIGLNHDFLATCLDIGSWALSTKPEPPSAAQTWRTTLATFGPLETWTLGPWTLGPLDTLDPYKNWTQGPSTLGLWILLAKDAWTLDAGPLGPLNSWILGPSTGVPVPWNFILMHLW